MNYKLWCKFPKTIPQKAAIKRLIILVQDYHKCNKKEAISFIIKDLDLNQDIKKYKKKNKKNRKRK